MGTGHKSWYRVGAAASALAVGASLVIAGSATAEKTTATAYSDSFSAMTQNLYLGSDVGVAMALLPDVPAAAQFMWDQVDATDFPARAPKLAATAAQHAPDVIGLQEATEWKCQKNLASKPIDIYNFTEEYLQATKAAGVEYVIAEKSGDLAFNEGFKIGPIPGLSVVYDPATFQPLWGQDSAACGFQLADALLVRADIADQVTAVGQNDYDYSFVIPGIPTSLIDLTRGYAWADVNVGGHNTRFVTTHLESLWTANERTASGIQSEELVADLAGVKKPLVVMGDFNNDPRDPRGPGEPNPGGQPTASAACPAQPANPTVKTAEADCNSYWTMRKGGYANASPDVNDPKNYSWGSQSELAGPDASRIDDALAMGNPAGFTDRLDYMFVKNQVKLESKKSTEMIGNEWPYASDTWTCGPHAAVPPLTVTQEQNTADMSKKLADAGVIDNPITDGKGVCFPTDHAGIVSKLRVVMETDLIVKARAKRKALKVGKKTEVIHRVKTNGKIKKVKTNCYVGGHKVTGKQAKKVCRIKIRIKKSNTNAVVKVTPKCSVGVKVKSKVVAKASGAPRAIWHRTWKIKKKPRVVCSLYGKG